MKLTTKQLTLCALLTAMALALSYLENLFPLSLAIPIPGVKLGLANIVTVFALYAMGPGQALLILLARCFLGALFAGAAAHNCGQIAAAMLTLGSSAPLYYLPVLLAVSLFTGGLTGLASACLFQGLRSTNLMKG